MLGIKYSLRKSSNFANKIVPYMGYDYGAFKGGGSNA